MTVKRKWVKPAILATVLATAGGLGIAAANQGDGWGHRACSERPGQGHGYGHGFGHKSGMFSPGRHLEGKLAFLKAELKITDDQESAWQAFAEVVRRNEQARAEQWQARRERHEEMKDDDSTGYKRPALDERIDRGIEHMERRLAAMKEMGDAAKALYGELTPDQQKVADGLLSRRHGRRAMF